MKKLKKLLPALLLALALIITSCGGNEAQTGENGNETEKTEQDGADGDQTVVRFAMWDKNQEKIMRQLADNFEKDHPDIKVQIEMGSFKDHFTKLETQASGNVMPDLVFMNGPNFIKFASNGLLEPLDDIVADSDINMDDFPESLVNLYTYEGKLYGIPKDWDLTALWYNKEIFDEAGVDYPTDEWTWDDMKAAAEKITDEDKGIWGVGSMAETQEGIYDTIPAMGGYIISDDMKKSGYDSEAAVEGTKVWLDLIEEGISPNLSVMTDTSPVELFKAGKLGMCYAASWNIAEFMENENIKDKVDLVVLPKLKERKATIHGLSYGLVSSSENKEAAAEFLKYLGSKEANDIWAKSGVVIPANEKSLDLWLKSYENLNLQAYVDELDYSVMYPISKNTAKWNELETRAINEMFSFQKEPEEVLKNLADQMNKVLEEEK